MVFDFVNFVKGAQLMRQALAGVKVFEREINVSFYSIRSRISLLFFNYQLVGQNS